MPLYLADVHLHRVRLAASQPTEARRKQFPDADPKAELAKGRALIEAHGYWRRHEELADAEAAAPQLGLSPCGAVGTDAKARRRNGELVCVTNEVIERSVSG